MPEETTTAPAAEQPKEKHKKHDKHPKHDKHCKHCGHGGDDVKKAKGHKNKPAKPAPDSLAGLFRTAAKAYKHVSHEKEADQLFTALNETQQDDLKDLLTLLIHNWTPENDQ